MKLCLIDLAEITGGRLQLAAMPPLDGELAQFRRLVLSPELAGSRDVFWQLAAQPGDAEIAFFHGALGVVATGRRIEPWPGRFSLQVDDSVAALQQFVERLGSMAEQSFLEPSELKVLQLCAARPFSIPPPTCGRSAKSVELGRCRRQAA